MILCLVFAPSSFERLVGIYHSEIHIFMGLLIPNFHLVNTSSRGEYQRAVQIIY